MNKLWWNVPYTYVYISILTYGYYALQKLYVKKYISVGVRMAYLQKYVTINIFYYYITPKYN